ncbi:uncharacterized protein PV09_05574 [Verruconis gallopava]|uniref:Mid2 domain-containing protein n=1 Tax=Verruconis gallopava TaxID=253628 RepID=A0A0D1XLS1_9PEZI|nr:uncharacterized protein PV09_05574 [Verruconis gallopava]KIW03366.1 hypothetical protein PV09_05574 [Verruconis gallopava]
MAAAATTTSTPTPTTFIALSTIFTPPLSCSSSWTYEPSDFNGNPSGLFIQNAVGGNAFNTACWPPYFTQNGRDQVVGTVQVYSPGACPVGYTSNIIAPGDTTTVTCCQSGFTYHFSSATSDERAAGALAGCISTFSSDETTTVLARPLGTLTPNTLIVTSTLDGASLGQVTMWGQPITIAYQQKDLSLFSTSSSSASATGSVTLSNLASASTSNPVSSSSQTQPGNTSSGLSTGAKAGIGVGVAVAVLAILGMAFFLFSRQKRQQSPHHEPYSAAYVAEPQYPPQEMDATSARVEMSHVANPISKVDPRRVHEIEGSTDHYT